VELNQNHSNDAKAPMRIKNKKLAKELPRDWFKSFLFD
jgi:hypothetical protein